MILNISFRIFQVFIGIELGMRNTQKIDNEALTKSLSLSFLIIGNESFVYGRDIHFLSGHL